MTEEIINPAAPNGERKPTREQRGIALFRDRGKDVVWNIDGTFSVPSRSKPNVNYTVDLNEESCTCPDYFARGVLCQHIFAATMKKAQALAEAEEKMAEIRRRSAERHKDRLVFTAEQVLANLEKLEA